MTKFRKRTRVLLSITSGYCCSSENYEINEICESFDTVSDIECNPVKKVVKFTTDSSVTPVARVQQALTSGGFKAHLISSEVTEVEEVVGSESQSGSCCGGGGDCGHSHSHSHDVSGGASGMVEAVFSCPSICCSSEVPLIEEAVDGLRGIFGVEVDVPGKSFTVEYDCSTVSVEDIVAVVTKLDMKVTLQDSTAPQIDTQSVQKGRSSSLRGAYFAIVSSASTLHIYDSDLQAVSFTFDKPGPYTMLDLCFSTGDVDADLLSACFDENGLHGESEETCMCGDPQPHIHAHLKNATCCDGSLSAMTKVKLVVSSTPSTIAFDISEALPSGCNSVSPSKTVHSEILPIRVKHGDHYDELVVNSEDVLLLRNPNANDCCDGEDFHGALSKVATRDLGNSRVLKFFAPEQKPFRLLDYVYDSLPSLDLRSPGRVKAALDILPNEKGCCSSGTCSAKKKYDCDEDCDDDHSAFLAPAEPSSTGTSGRSSLHVAGICCASEVPPIKSIIEPMAGVSKVSVNVTAKIVYVEHDFTTTSASAIVQELNKAKFDATIRKDASQETKSTCRSTFFVENICCASEIPPIKSIIEPLKGVSKVSINVTNKIVYVEHEPSATSASIIMEELNSAKFGCTIREDGGALSSTPSEVTKSMSLGGMRINVALSGLLWIVSMFSKVDPAMEWLQYLACFAFVIGIYPIAIKAFGSIKRKNIDANTLMLIASVGAMGLRDYTEAAGLTFLFSLGEWLETRATGKARNALESIVELKPDTAEKITKDGNVITVAASAVSVGDLLLVRSGDKVPCDGVVEKGVGVLDESSLTGESRPVKKVLQDCVFSGTINVGQSPLTIRSTATTENSAVSKLIALVEEAQASRSETEKLVDEFAKRYTPIVIISSFLMCTIPWFVNYDVGLAWLEKGIMLIVIACPCALIISTPVTYVAGLAATAQRGIIVKGGIHLEALSRVKTVGLDKTGTLTEGEFKMLDLVPMQGWKRKKVLELLGAMEAEASHPMAIALVKAAERYDSSFRGMTVDNHRILKGEGIMGDVDGKAVYVGNIRLINRIGMKIDPEDEKRACAWDQQGGTVGYIGVEGVGVVGMFQVADKIRDQSSDAVAALHALGVDVYMLTGDGKGAAEAVCRNVGIPQDRCKSELLPKDKMDYVRYFRKSAMDPESKTIDIESGGSTATRYQGGEEEDAVSVASTDAEKRLGLFAGRTNVLMCGDGVNDAPALAAADVGVAMAAGGAAIAMETADVALIDSDIAKLVYCIKMGRDVVHVIKQNLIFSLITKLIVISFVLTGHGSLWLAIGSDVGAMLCVTMNGMRLLPRKTAVDLTSYDDETNKNEEDSSLLRKKTTDYGSTNA